MTLPIQNATSWEQFLPVGCIFNWKNQVFPVLNAHYCGRSDTTGGRSDAIGGRSDTVCGRSDTICGFKLIGAGYNFLADGAPWLELTRLAFFYLSWSF